MGLALSLYVHQGWTCHGGNDVSEGDSVLRKEVLNVDNRKLSCKRSDTLGRYESIMIISGNMKIQ